MPTFEENEERRLDLAEREITVRERALERDTGLVRQDVESNIGHRHRLEELREQDIADRRKHEQNVIENLDRHEALLERMAAALESIASNSHKP
jgi:hypothetical protein